MIRSCSCPQCGVVFDTENPVKKFCNEKCRIKNTNLRWKDRRREWAKKSYKDKPRYRAERISSARTRNYRLGKADELTIRRIASLLWRTCSYCGKTGGTIDHIVPLSKGGDHHWSNLLPCCRSCNSSKRDRDVFEFMGIDTSKW